MARYKNYSPLIISVFLTLHTVSTASAQAPEIEGCQIFPADNIWNVPVDTLPRHSRSDDYVNSIGLGAHVHPEFGSGLYNGGPIGIPFITVSASQPTVPMSFYYADGSDPGPYPIPPNVPIEGGEQSDGDRHVLVLERDSCTLYEVYDSHLQQDGSWSSGSGAIFNLNSHALRPETWTSADAAGLPILPGLVRYDEVAAGEIRHAIRVTAPRTQRAYVWPARHYASSETDATLPPMGQRFRLKASVDISGFPADVQVVLRAMKKFGVILADNGSSWFITGAPDERWNNDNMHLLQQIIGSDFEAVDVSSLQISADSGQTRATAAERVVTNDVDGDQISDIIIWRPSLGMWFILTSRSNFNFASHLSYQHGLSGDIPLTGDADGDGRADLIVWRPSDGAWFIRSSASEFEAATSVQWGLSGDVPLGGDYDGDGRMELGVYRPNSGTFYILKSSGGFNRDGAIAGGSAYLTTVQLGGLGHDVVWGDFTGDGVDDFVTVWQPARFWSVAQSTGALLWSLPWGAPGDTPLACDWDNNGTSDRVIVRPSESGTLDWWIALDSGGAAVSNLGSYGDTPSCNKDFDGDGRGDSAVFHPVDGIWSIRQSSSSQTQTIQFGLPGDIAL